MEAPFVLLAVWIKAWEMYMPSCSDGTTVAQAENKTPSTVLFLFLFLTLNLVLVYIWNIIFPFLSPRAPNIREEELAHPSTLHP